MKPTEVEKLLKADGWELNRQRGSHRVYTHPTKPGRVVLAWHNKDIAKGTLHDIFKAADIKRP
jgi:predicted RNA binding protein YcfA (HicA-like mRNA interferase family)